MWESPQAKSLLHCLQRTAGGIWPPFQSRQNVYFNQSGDISTLIGGPLKLVDKFTYQENSISSPENDINTQLAKAWTAINTLSVIWKSGLIDKIKHSFFPSSCHINTAIWMHHLDANLAYGEKVDGIYTRMLRAVLNKYWRQDPTKQQLYGHLPPISKAIQIRWTRHAGHCWRNKNEVWTNS